MSPLATYDVSFLLRPDASRSIIYRYRTGLLLPRVRRKIAETLMNNGGGLNSTAAGGLVEALTNVGLFEQYVAFCRWPTEKLAKWRQLADVVLEALSLPNGKKVVLFAHADSSLFDSAFWQAASMRCLIIEEPDVTVETLPSVMDYYWWSTDLAFCPMKRDSFQSQVRARGFEQRFPAIDQFFNAVDRAMLLEFKDQEGELPALEILDEAAAERSNILRPLRRLLENEPDAIEALVQGGHTKLRLQLLSAEEIIAEMYDVARDLLLEIVDADRDAKIATDQSLRYRTILWSICVLVGMLRLLHVAQTQNEKLADEPETFLADFDFLCRDFQRRLVFKAANPISDWWHEIKPALARFEDYRETRWPSPEERLISALHACLCQLRDESLMPSWIRRLSTLVGLAADLRGQRMQTAEAVPQ